MANPATSEDISPQKPGVAQELGPATLVLGDAIRGMKHLQDQTFDLAIVDPPYGASTRAQWEIPADHGLPSFGGSWQLAAHDWDRLVGSESFNFTLQWLKELQRLVKPTGSIWIHSTYHNSGFANVACQMLGLEIINEVVWFKRNAFPNLARRRLTASHETLLWVHTGSKKREYRFNYDDVKNASFSGDSIHNPGKQLRTVWDIPNNKTPEEQQFGRFPVQKPLRLTDRLFLISGVAGGAVLVPFVGSGTEMVAALNWKMCPTGFETSQESFDLAKQRIEFALSQQNPSLFEQR